MLKQVLKLIRIFQTFTIDDLLPILECSISEILPILKQLETKQIIVKNNNKYFYLKADNEPKKTLKNNKKRKFYNKIYDAEYLMSINKYYETIPEKLFYKEDDVAFFKEAYPSLKKRIIMYLKIIDKTYNMDLAATEIYIKNLKKQYPTLKFKNTTTIKLRENFMKIGLRAFETPKVHQKNFIPEKVYSDFKKLYLYSTRYSLQGAYRELGNMGYNIKLIPCYKIFCDRLKEDYTLDEINNLRNTNSINPLISEVSFDILKTYANSTSTKVFNDTVAEFLNNYPDKNTAIYKKRKRHINIHLLPYFNNLTWDKITESKIKEFIRYKSEECYYKNETIREILFTLFKIKREYVDGLKKEETCLNRLNNEEIKQLKNDIPKLWIISTGFTLEELLGLKYEDINYEKKTILSKNICENNKLIEINRRTLWKEVRIPNKLLSMLPKNQTGPIFTNIKIDNIESLRNTFLFLCIDKKVPFYVIAKQLGYNSLQVFYNEYKKYLPNGCDIDLLEDIF